MFNHNQRITLNDSMQSAAVKLVEGNPGAIRVIMEMIDCNESVDPDCAFGALGPLIALDSWGIYGPRIWMLYKDVCNHSAHLALALLRSCQMGILASEQLDDAIDRRTKLDIIDILDRLHQQLPNFVIPTIKEPSHAESNQ